MEEQQPINQEIIERLMKEDLSFMYKIDLVKDQIVKNLGTYAESIGEFEDTLGLNENESRKLSSSFSAMTESLGTIGEKITQLQIEVPDYNNEMSYKFDDMADRLQDGFLWLSEKLTDNISNVLEVVEQNTTEPAGEGVFEKDANNVVITDMSDKVFDTLNREKGNNNIKSGSFLDTLAQLFNERKTGGNNFIAMLKGALLSKLGLAGAFAGVAGLGFAGLLISAIAINAFNGLKGYMVKDTWGVSAVSAIFGGIFGAGSAGGKGGAKRGAIGGAITGMTLGFPAGIIGVVIGGALGGALGAIGGWIGSEKLATGFDSIWQSPVWRTVMMGASGAAIGFAMTGGNPVGLVIGAIIGAALSAISIFIDDEQRNKISDWWTDKKTDKRNRTLRKYSTDDEADLSDVALEHQMKEWNLVGIDGPSLRYLKRLGIDVLNDDVMAAVDEFSKKRWDKHLSEYEGGFSIGGAKGFAAIIERIIGESEDSKNWFVNLMKEQAQQAADIEIIDVSSDPKYNTTELEGIKENVNKLLDSPDKSLETAKEIAREIINGIGDGIVVNVPPSPEPAFDFSGMREATTDNAYTWRGDYHNRGGNIYG